MKLPKIGVFYQKDSRANMKGLQMVKDGIIQVRKKVVIEFD